MHVQTEQKPYDTINVTPMLDLAYVLLVIFIIMTTASVQGLEMNLPKPSNKPVEKPKPIQLIVIDDNGSLTWNSAPVSLTEIESRMQANKAQDAEFSVMIQGKPGARYDQVIEVVDTATRVGVGIGLITSRVGT